MKLIYHDDCAKKKRKLVIYNHVQKHLNSLLFMEKMYIILISRNRFGLNSFRLITFW